jgi:flagellar hook-associated protein 2
MSGISSGIGLVSGINSRDIIDQLMALEARPKDRLQTRIDTNNEQKLAYTDLATRLTSMRVTATLLKKPSSFTDAKATSSNEDVLTATASRGAAIGSYQLRVARLVTTQQLVGRGFADFDTAKVGAGTLTIEMGGGEVTSSNNLTDLNGGAGVRRGVFRITDRSGASSVIDISDAVTLDDVVKRINNTLGVNVRAGVEGDKLVVNDLTGLSTANLTIQDIGDGGAAADLGIAGSVAAASLAGTAIHRIGLSTSLALLNDGRGVRTAPTGGDFTLNFRDGSTATVTLANAKTVGEVLDVIRAAGGSKLSADVAPDGKGLRLTDNTGGGGSFSVAAIGTSNAAKDLGLLGTAAAASLEGSPLIASLGSVLLASLKGGAGLSLGTINVKSRAAGSGIDIDLSGARTVSDLIGTINAANAGVKASVNASGNGIQIADTSGGTGAVVIADTTGTGAASLGIAGTFTTATPLIKGANLQRQWVSENSLLADLNGGKGVKAGTFRITDGNGLSRLVSIDTNDVRLGEVVNKINAAGLAINARVNDNGDGLLIASTGGTAGTLKVEQVSGSAAADLNLTQPAVAGVINGSYEKTLEVTTADTLATLQTKLNNLNFGVSASIINDGSGTAPYRLSLTGRNGGRDGRVVFDTGATTLDTRSLVEAQDAAVFVGGADGQQPLLVTAGSNSLSGVIRGVNVELTGTSREPVTLGVSRSVDSVVEGVGKFVTSFNELTAKVKELTRFDTETNTRGLLLGDSAVQNVESQLYAAIQTVVADNGKFRVLADVGVRVTAGGLEFDEEKFRTAYADDPDSVSRLFSKAGSAIDEETSLGVLNAGAGIRTNPLGADLRISVKDGTDIDVDLSDAQTMGDVLRAINTAAGVRLTASLNTLGTALVLTDNTTTGTAAFKVQAINGSLAATDLGILGNGKNGKVEGRTIRTNRSADVGGVGAAIEARINRLIDPVSGLVTRQSKQIDDRNTQMQSRIKSIDKLLEAKRARLERQFAQLESTLANLQNQQSAIGQIQTIRMPQRSGS